MTLEEVTLAVPQVPKPWIQPEQSELAPRVALRGGGIYLCRRWFDGPCAIHERVVFPRPDSRREHAAHAAEEHLRGRLVIDDVALAAPYILDERLLASTDAQERRFVTSAGGGGVINQGPAFPVGEDAVGHDREFSCVAARQPELHHFQVQRSIGVEQRRT